MKRRVLPIEQEGCYGMKFPAYLSKKASHFQCSIYFIQENKKLNVKSLLSMMIFILSIRSVLIIETNGVDEDEAMKEMIRILTNPFKKEGSKK